ncbi:MAG TPA: hypothetical protein VFO52_07510 [Longimicrobiales bacterium]|nr:hypothetical protein [Longimicrobiales bacterium]
MPTTQSRSELAISRVEELTRAKSLSTVQRLVVTTPAQPKGDLLVALGRVSVEYPDMQKVAVMAGQPPLPVAVYLAARGVQMNWPERGSDNQED